MNPFEEQHLFLTKRQIDLDRILGQIAGIR
jgi:hypothetical protein